MPGISKLPPKVIKAISNGSIHATNHQRFNLKEPNRELVRSNLPTNVMIAVSVQGIAPMAALCVRSRENHIIFFSWLIYIQGSNLALFGVHMIFVYKDGKEAVTHGPSTTLFYNFLVFHLKARFGITAKTKALYTTLLQR